MLSRGLLLPYRFLARYTMALWAVVAVALVTLTVVTSVSYSHSYSRAQEQYQTRAHFYRVIADQDAADDPSAVNQLALDLKSRLGGLDEDADGLPREVQSFNGDSNAYGGVRDALGVNPFESSRNCYECGHLSGPMKDNLLQIKRGHVAGVIASEAPTKKSTTPFLVIAVLWLVVGPALWVRRFIGVERRRRRDYPEECYLIDQLDNVLASLPEGDSQRPELERARQELQAITRGRDDRAQTIIEEARLQLEARKLADRELEAAR